MDLILIDFSFYVSVCIMMIGQVIFSLILEDVTEKAKVLYCVILSNFLIIETEKDGGTDTL